MSRSEEFHHSRWRATQADVEHFDMPDYLSDEGEEMTSITARRAGQGVGWMTLFPTGHVANVEVEPEHRRTGVATSLWHEAERAGYEPKHSGRFTPEGLQWARSVSGQGIW